ncbi:MAG TPA: efflux RND transporter periplasmic adaptor subunit [Gemmatimonadaceae bacterium]
MSAQRTRGTSRLFKRLSWAMTAAVSGWSMACSATQDGADADAPADSSSGSVVLTAAQIQTGGVAWAPVEARMESTRLEVPAQLVPDADRTARLGAPASGRIMAVHAQPGDRVSRGTALVTLQSPEASSAQADYDKAVAELSSRRAAATYARTARERAERLLAAKVLPRQDAERAQADEELARASLSQAETELARARALMTQLGVDSTPGLIVIRSPMDGVVLSRDAQPGMMVGGGIMLVTVSDPGTLWLEAAVPERAASTIRTGAVVRFTVGGFPTDTMSARVRSVAGALDTTTRTVPVRAIVNNSSRRLRAAMFATAWLDLGERREIVVVPDRAIQLVELRPVVFVVHPDGTGGARFERRFVELGGGDGSMRSVLNGLAPDDTVVVDGAFLVKSELLRARMAQEGD